MKFLLLLFGFFFLVVTVVIGMFVLKVRVRMRKLRDAMFNQMDDDAFQRMADKNYWRKHRNDGPKFDENYFKGDPNSWRNKQQQQQQQRRQQRTTRTADGVTIVDDRTPGDRNKKIFTKEEGEYVEFSEE